jgi:hypothetical protein
VKKLSNSMLKIFPALVALCMFLPAISAAELQPVVTVSFAGYSELLADIDALGKLTGKPDLGKTLEGLMNMMTQGKVQAVLDKNKPIGAVILNDSGEEFTSYVFLPVSDLKQLIELAKNPMTGEAPKEENGVYQIQGGAQTIYATQKGNWAFLAQKKEILDSVANDPAALLGDLPKNYLLAVRAAVKNIPEPVRQMGLAQMQMIMQMSGMQPDMVAQNIEQYEKLSKELDVLTIGLNLDRQTNNLTLDLDLVAKPGTNLATQLAAAKPGKSDFTGLKLSGAAITLNAATVITDEDVARAKTSLEALRASTAEELKNQDLEKEQLDLATQVLSDLFDVAVKTLELKKTDYGAALILEPDAVTFAAGSILGDSAKLENAIKKLLAEAAKEEAAKIKNETYKDFRTYGMSLPVTDQSLAPLLGETFDVVIAVSDQKGFIAAGRNADKTLKEAIDKSLSDAGKEIPASEIVISGSKIAKFVSAIAPDDEPVKGIALMLAGALEQSGGKDHITIVTQPVENGARIRLQFEEGILKAIGGMAPPMIPGM